MQKIYCDFCGDEIYDKNRFDSTGIKSEMKKGQIKIEVRLLVETHTSGLDCCKYCIIKAAKQLDDRPVESESINCTNCGERIIL